MARSSRTLQLSHELPRGRHNLPREVVIRSQRERIIDAMIESTVEHGYGAVTASDVVRGAGVSRKTFYEHFDDKEGCFLAAYEEIVRHLLSDTADAYGTEEPWRRRVAAGLKAILELLASRPKLARFAVIEIMAAGPRALNRRDEVLRQLSYLIEPGRDEVPPGIAVPDLAAAATVGALYAIVYDEILHGRGAELVSRYADLLHVALAPYIGPRAAAREAARARSADVAR
jgi:AcrR family transcriptional regulator